MAATDKPPTKGHGSGAPPGEAFSHTAHSILLMLLRLFMMAFSFAQSGTTGGKAHRFRQGFSFTQDHVRREAPPWDACESLQCASGLVVWP